MDGQSRADELGVPEKGVHEDKEWGWSWFVCQLRAYGVTTLCMHGSNQPSPMILLSLALGLAPLATPFPTGLCFPFLSC